MTDTDQPGGDDAEAGKPVELSLEFPTRRIALGCGEQSVEVQGPDELDALAGLAERLWTLTAPPRPARTGFAGGGALVTEIAAENGA